MIEAIKVNYKGANLYSQMDEIAKLKHAELEYDTYGVLSNYDRIKELSLYF